MKKILLLFSGKRRNSLHNPTVLGDLLRETGKNQGLEAQVDTALYEDLLYIVDGSNSSITHMPTGIDIASYDFVYQRRWEDKLDQALACAIYLKNKKVAFSDSESYRPSSFNKHTQAWRFWEANLPHPATAVVGGSNAQKTLLSKIELLPFAFPFIAKELNGAGGNNNHLVTDKDMFTAILRDNYDMQFVLQEYIPNAGDYRLLVCGDTVRLAMLRTSAEGKHTNNTTQGGQAKLQDVNGIDKAIITDTIKAAQLMSRDIAGVDVVLHQETGKHYFFEVNRCPQIETGQFVQQKADVLFEYLYNEGR